MLTDVEQRLASTADLSAVYLRGLAEVRAVVAALPDAAELLGAIDRAETAALDLVLPIARARQRLYNEKDGV